MKSKIVWLICTFISLMIFLFAVNLWLEREATEKIIQTELDERGWTDRHERLNYNIKFGSWSMFTRYDSYPGEEYEYSVEDEIIFKDKIKSLFGHKLDYEIFGEGHCDENVKCETKRTNHKYDKKLKVDAKYGLVHNRSTGLEPYMEGKWLK